MEDLSEADRFTPLERIAVIVVVTPCICFGILGLLGMLFSPQNQFDQGNIAAAKAQIKQFDTALVVYKRKFGAFPSKFELLFKPPSGEPIMNTKQAPLDPWGNPYQYSLVGSVGYVVMSLGADGAPGGEGVDADIKSDEITNESAK